jgi:hypothetical protein
MFYIKNTVTLQAAMPYEAVLLCLFVVQVIKMKMFGDLYGSMVFACFSRPL